MVFPSMPVYVDPPPNWQQQPNHHHHQTQTQAVAPNGSELLPPLPPQAQAPLSLRPGSMADRARLAKIPPPEAALKCPRCESTNTKFCYFNNYSLSQPRHFCKTCRRYWTRGGALRNVPVGGGCRRNKKNKRSRSKSPASTDKQTLNSSTGGTGTDLLPQPPTLPFMSSLHNLTRYGVSSMGALGLRDIQGQTDHPPFQVCTSTPGGGAVDQWRLQHFPFLNGFESSSYPFQSDSIEAPSGLVAVGDIGASSSRVTQLPSVKMEENGPIHLSRSPLNVSDHTQYYSWTDISALAAASSSSSATHLL